MFEKYFLRKTTVRALDRPLSYSIKVMQRSAPQDLVRGSGFESR